MTDRPKQDPEANKNPENDPEGYKIGYGKPPKHAQYKPGQSGNRRGRPGRDGAEPYGDLFDRISDEKIIVHENGRAICLRGLQVLARRVVDLGIAGDPESEKILIKIEQPDLKPPSGGLEFFEVDSDDEIQAKEQELSRCKKSRGNSGARAPVRFGRGRPRHDAPFPELVKRELAKRIEIQVNGRTAKVTKREAWMRRLWNDAMNGKPRALRLYMTLAKPTDPRRGLNFFIVGGR